MSLMTRSCGLLVALTGLACSACGFYYVYFVLTFNLFMPKTVAQNFRENRLIVVLWSLASLLFFIASIGVFSRRMWASSLCFGLSALALLYAAAQIFVRGGFDLYLQPVEIAEFMAVSLSVLAWLVSKSGRTYFRQAVQTA